MKSKILIVDDDASVRQSFARVLGAENYLTLLARNGKEAQEILASTPIDLVMLDLNMPVQDGWQTFVNLSLDYPLIPIIIITARPNQFFSALAAGVGALMEKPLDFPKLLKTISELLGEPLAMRQARMAGAGSPLHYFPPTTLVRE